MATSDMVQRSLQVAADLAREGIEVEVVDPRTLVSLDEETLLASVEKTGRFVVVDECHRRVRGGRRDRGDRGRTRSRP